MIQGLCIAMESTPCSTPHITQEPGYIPIAGAHRVDSADIPHNRRMQMIEHRHGISIGLTMG